MSRSGYSDDCENLELWRANIRRATHGKRGQMFFRELLAALDAMPTKSLVANELGTEEVDGPVCTLGSLARAKKLALTEDDAFDYPKLGASFDIAASLAQEVMYVNDESGPDRGETDEERWTRVRAWAAKQIIPTVEEVPQVTE